MKYRMFVSVVAASLLFVSSFVSAEPRQRARTNAVNGVELKMRPSLYAPAIAALPHNTFVMLWGGQSTLQQVNGVQGRWVYVQSPHGRGWVFDAHLRVDSAVKSDANNTAKRESTDRDTDEQKRFVSLERTQ